MIKKDTIWSPFWIAWSMNNLKGFKHLVCILQVLDECPSKHDMLFWRGWHSSICPSIYYMHEEHDNRNSVLDCQNGEKSPLHSSAIYYIKIVQEYERVSPPSKEHIIFIRVDLENLNWKARIWKWLKASRSITVAQVVWIKAHYHDRTNKTMTIKTINRNEKIILYSRIIHPYWRLMNVQSNRLNLNRIESRWACPHQCNSKGTNNVMIEWCLISMSFTPSSIVRKFCQKKWKLLQLTIAHFCNDWTLICIK